MAVRPGYKQTEVGVIPEEWEVQTFGSLTTLLTNGFVGTATTAYVESDDGILYIRLHREPLDFDLEVRDIILVHRSFSYGRGSALRAGRIKLSPGGSRRGSSMLFSSAISRHAPGSPSTLPARLLRVSPDTIF